MVSQCNECPLKLFSIVINATLKEKNMLPMGNIFFLLIIVVSSMLKHGIKFFFPLLVMVSSKLKYGSKLFFPLIDVGAQWLSGRVLDSRPRGQWFEPHQPHCVVSLNNTH